MSERLFVYGTLRAGAHPMHDVLAAAAELLGPGRCRGRLVDLGWYPGLVPTTDERWVVGELWLLLRPTVLGHLDTYEGDEYERRMISVQLADGTSVPAWSYVLKEAPDHGRTIDSGDWMLYRRVDR